MSEPEFESYLSLLSRFLRLDARQREEIRRELRAHLEDALQDEFGGGADREEALRHILDDFGDAAELAARFSKLGRRRRWLMHATMAAACIGFVFLTISVFSPDETEPIGVGTSVAQAQDAAYDTPDALDDARIERALTTTLEQVTFEDAPFDEVLAWLNGVIQVNLHVQWRQLEDYGVARDAPMTVNLRNVTASRLLRLLLDEFEASLTYEIQDGILVISTRQAFRRRTTIKVYDVRDILGVISEATETGPAPTGASGAAGTGAFFAGRYGAPGMTADQPAGPRSHGDRRPGGGRTLADASPQPHPVEHAAEELLELLTNAIEPDTWVTNGGEDGYVQILNGLLVVRQYETVHDDIRGLLSDLRAVGGQER